MTTPAPAAASAPAAVPGKTLGIVGLILAFIGPLSLLGLILSIVAKVQSKRAGVKNTPATVGIVIAIIVIVLTVVLWVVDFATLFSACAGLDPGTYQLESGGTLTCG
jgi:hypothetical protein